MKKITFDENPTIINSGVLYDHIDFCSNIPVIGRVGVSSGQSDVRPITQDIHQRTCLCRFMFILKLKCVSIQYIQSDT